LLHKGLIIGVGDLTAIIFAEPQVVKKFVTDGFRSTDVLVSSLLQQHPG